MSDAQLKEALWDLLYPRLREMAFETTDDAVNMIMKLVKERPYAA